MSATELDTGGRAAGPPSARLRNIGDYLNFAVIDIDNAVPMTKFGSKDPDLRADGTQKMAVRVTALVVDGNAVRTDGETDTPLEVGEVCSIYISGYAKYDPDQDKISGTHVSWGAALDRLTDGGAKFGVGTVGQWLYLQDLPASKAGNDPRKDRKFALRPYDPETESAQWQKCEQLRIELSAAPQTELVGASAGPAQPPANIANF